MSTNSQPQVKRDAVTFIKSYWLPIVLAILAVIFIVTNTDRTDLTIVWFTITTPLWLTLTVTVLVGFIVGWFVGRRKP